ncbi:glucokinase [Prosthecobacter fusiformis]|uniref:Glucokinase n=1 Tax=Prosthecobacter fusiformis TaxID=48464 RepID=A0A4R7RJ72_9BACT|nr:ROK family protein [Prosthecobacter fusiformis]TDU64049.1 glucokinase [Prosthecobacter fusiformis]
MNVAIGIDLGGTNIKAALIECETGKLVTSFSRPTLDGEFVDGVPRFALTVRGIVEELEAQAGGGRLRVGLSAPGLANPNGRCIDWMPGRMHGLEKLDWPTFLDRHVNVLNDAHAALLGEVWVGAARGCQNVFMVTLGTGVGGAIFCDGRILKGAIGRAGHLGHVSTDVNAPTDLYGTPGSLEVAIGNKTIQERGEGRYATTLALLEAVATGDEHAVKVWLESLRHLGAALGSLINVLDPELIILGGGIATGAGDRLLKPLSVFLDEYEWRPGGKQVRLALASLGDEAGAYGCVKSVL